MPETAIANPGLMSKLLNSVLTSPRPTMGCEISQTGVGVARWSRIGSSLEAASWRALPPGAVEASPLRENIQDEAAVHGAIQQVLSQLGFGGSAQPHGSANVVLIVPDQSARLFVLDFEKVPKNQEEGLSLVRWRLKKSVPFDVDAAAISYFVQRPGGTTQVVAVASPRPVIRQYEAAVLKFGLRPTVVVPSSLAALQLVGGQAHDSGSATSGGEAQAAGVLFIKYSPPWFTTAIVQQGILRLFRTINLNPREDGTLAPEAVLSSVYPSIVYFQDAFHADIGGAFACGIGSNSLAVAAALDSDLGIQTKFLAEESEGLMQGGDLHEADRNFSALLGMAREK